MKEQKLYICEYCNTSYKDKKQCQACEKGHCKPVKIKDCRYISLNNNIKGYPNSIYVEMEDGTTQIYKR